MKKSIYCTVIALTVASCKNPDIEIPFNYERNIYLKARLNDTIESNIMFDTGAYGLWLDSSYNERPGLGFGYYSGDIPGYDGLRKLKFSTNEISYVPDYFSPINAKRSFGRQCDGIVGWELLKNHVIEINYEDSLMRIQDRNQIDKTYTKIPLIFKNKGFFIKMTVIIHPGLVITGNYLLDTGYGGIVLLTGETVREHNIDSTAGKKIYFARDWGTIQKSKSLGFILRAQKIKIDTLELTEFPVECFHDTTGILSDGEYVGLLGNRALENFDVIIDFAGKELYLRPRINYEPKRQVKGIGAGFTDRTDICEGLIVTSLFLNSDAHKAGIKSGDLITHFDGKPLKHNSAEMIKNFYNSVGKNVSITLKRKDSTFVLNLKVTEQL